MFLHFRRIYDGILLNFRRIYVSTNPKFDVYIFHTH
jgi:hypothetical protein